MTDDDDDININKIVHTSKQTVKIAHLLAACPVSLQQLSIKNNNTGIGISEIRNAILAAHI